MIRLGREPEPDFKITDLDRRKYPRFSNALPIEYWPAGNSKIRLGYTTNISEGGLRVSLPEQMNLGEKLRLNIYFFSDRHLTTFHTIEVTGRVVWTKTDAEKAGYECIGMEFEEISPENLDSLREFLNHFGDRF